MPAFRPTSVVIHPDVAGAYAALESDALEDRNPQTAIWKSFKKAVDLVKQDGLWGEVVPTIPRHFVEKYGVTNLYCVDLAVFHRAFYTIRRRDVIFLDLVDHAAYDRWFPGRGR